MNVARACQLLDISPKDIHTPLLKKKYKKLSLLFHPDKRGDSKTFIELKEAYDFLSNQPKEESFLESFDESLLRKYIHTLHHSNVEVFKHPLFIRYFVEPVQLHLQSYKTYVFTPTLSQLFRKDIFYLEEEKLYIPLWHQEIVFHGKIKIQINPILPEGIEIDEDNNILVSYTIHKNKECVLMLDGISISMNPESKERKLIKKGIPRIKSFIYDVSELSDITLLPF
jgi:hypothetical protein